MLFIKKIYTYFFYLLIIFSAAVNSAEIVNVDKNAIAKFIEEQIEPIITEGKASAVAITVVKDGREVLSKVIGYSNQITKQSIGDEYLQIWQGSTTKALMAIAIMQLYDKGIIKSLNDPVNDYLKRIQLPGEYGNAVTIMHLLTNASGLSSMLYGRQVYEDKTPQIPATIIQQIIPKIAMKPGLAFANTNIDNALLGLTVEDLTNMPIADYYYKNILIPAGMKHTTINYKSTYNNELLTAYSAESNGDINPFDIDFYNQIMAPALQISSSPQDMGKFMLMFLDTTAKYAHILPRKLFNEIMKKRNFDRAMFLRNAHEYQEDLIRVGGIANGANTELLLSPKNNFGIYVAIIGENKSKEASFPSSLINILFVTLTPGKWKPIDFDEKTHDVNEYKIDRLNIINDAKISESIFEQYQGDYKAIHPKKFQASLSIDKIISLLMGDKKVISLYKADGKWMLNNAIFTGQVESTDHFIFTEPGVQGIPISFMTDEDGRKYLIDPSYAKIKGIKASPFIIALDSDDLHFAIFICSFIFGTIAFLSIFFRKSHKGCLTFLTLSRLMMAVTILFVIFFMVLILGYDEGKDISDDFLIMKDTRFIIIKILMFTMSTVFIFLLFNIIRYIFNKSNKINRFFILHVSVTAISLMLFLLVMANYNFFNLTLI